MSKMKRRSRQTRLARPVPRAASVVADDMDLDDVMVGDPDSEMHALGERIRTDRAFRAKLRKQVKSGTVPSRTQILL
jgi:hypothetical protein